MEKYSNNSNKEVSSQEFTDTMTQLSFFKKVKRFNPLEPSIGIIGFILATGLFIGCFFYLDYKTVTRGLHYHGVSWLGLVPSSPPWAVVEGKVGFLEEGGDGCDLFDGEWVWDNGYPLYESKDCALVDDGFRCLENGRLDSFFVKWRWQPNQCNLPRFDAKLMLEKLRNRRLVFVGDSVGRNQWESLLCMLASVVPDNSSIYEVNENPITKHSGYLAFMFKEYNCTVEYYRAPFLVVQGRPPAGAPEMVKMTLRVDKLDWSSPQWRDANVLVFNSGHWWNYEKTIRMGCYFQEGEEVKMEMSVQTAYRKSIETLLEWLRDNVNMSKTQVLLRTYAPVHFRGGDWKSGGGCHLEKLPDLGQLPVSQDYRYSIFNSVISDWLNKPHVMNLNLLNVTRMTQRRKDAHPSIYYNGPGGIPASLHRQDCSHWCLPGVPDSWNELLYALFLKRESTHKKNATTPCQAPL